MPNQGSAVWTLQDAKNGFSEVVRAAMETGPQTVTRRGEEAVVIVDAKEFARMAHRPQSVYDFFHNSPLAGADLDLGRQQDEPRDVELPDL